MFLRPPRLAGALLATGMVLAAGGVSLITLRPWTTPAFITPAATPTTRASPLPARGDAPPRRIVPVPDIDAQSAVVLDLDRDRFLYRLDSDTERPIASLTKIFTAMVASDLLRLDTQVTVPSSITQLPSDATVMGLTSGERVSVRELLYGLFLNSGNDAAETLAQAALPRDAFVALMNDKALELGLLHTQFANPTGLDDPALYSSAYDLALAASHLDAHYPLLARIASTISLIIPATATHKAYSLLNFNRLLRTYPGATGLKPGYTGLAGGCVIATATRHGHHMLAVVLGSNNLYTTASSLLDYGYETVGVLPMPN